MCIRDRLLVDLADDAGVPLTELTPDTVNALEDVLDPELPAVNPLDAWSRGGPNAAENITRCLTLMMQDPGAALGVVIHDRAPDGRIYESYLAYMQRARADSAKPVALVAARQGTGHDRAVVSSTHAGFPVLDGVAQFLAGVRALFAYRDFLLREEPSPSVVGEKAVRQWRTKLAGGSTLSEFEALEMLSDFGIDTSKCVLANTANAAVAAASDMGYPVALKTAGRDMLHKSEHGGVMLDIADEPQLRNAYADMAERLGDDVLVAAMSAAGVEMLLGVKHDPQFGPVILIGSGGVLAETLGDVQFALPPFDAAHARRCVDRLQLRPLLDGVRGKAPVDIEAFCRMAARFSEMAAAVADVLAEVDVNPVIVQEHGAIAVDALVTGQKTEGS